MRAMRTAAYVYTGWHPVPERDASFHPGFTEWELVRGCRPRFPGHRQPKVPLLGEYDDRDPVAVGRRVALARDHGVQALVFGVFWCRGKRVFEAGLDERRCSSRRRSRGRRGPFRWRFPDRRNTRGRESPWAPDPETPPGVTRACPYS
jgi:hypothetical protein